MKKLSRKAFEQVSQSIIQYSRLLERKMYEYNYNNGSKEDILIELKKYQNEDGGFGNALESDFRMPFSSPKATSIGVRRLAALDDLEEARKMLQSAINYLEASYNPEKNRWFIASREINDFPHAPWWHFNEAEGMTLLDKDWGNPNAEIIAWLYRYRQYVKRLDVDALVEAAIAHIENKDSFLNEQRKFVRELKDADTPEYVMDYFMNERVFDSRGEIFCYMRLYGVFPKYLQERLEKRISAAIAQVIVYDDRKWGDYVPRPVDFAGSQDSCTFGVDKAKIEDNLDFEVQRLEAEGKINLPWIKRRNYYVGDLAPSYNEWIGVFTLGTLNTLKECGRIEQ